MAMGVLDQLGASLTGNIETAKLLIYDYRGTAQKTQKSLESKANSTFASDLANAGTDLEAKAKAYTTHTDALKGAKSTGLTEMANFRNGALSAEFLGLDFEDPVKVKTFLVHFNPSKLQVYSSNLPVKTPDAQGGEPVHDSATKGTLSMTVTLFFDEMNVYDSFMADKFTMGASVSGITNIASTVAKNIAGKTWSVQDEVEGLISALRNPYTRNVSFRWADFSFTGQLNTVSAQYTMFNTSGAPVRAQVLLRIKHEMDDAYLSKWFIDYDNAMMGERTNLTKASQYVGNILNFNL